MCWLGGVGLFFPDRQGGPCMGWCMGVMHGCWVAGGVVKFHETFSFDEGFRVKGGFLLWYLPAANGR